MKDYLTVYKYYYIFLQYVKCSFVACRYTKINWWVIKIKYKLFDVKNVLNRIVGILNSANTIQIYKTNTYDKLLCHLY